MEPTSFISSQFLRMFISLLFLFGAIKYRRYFLFTIPFLQYAGYVFMIKGRPPEMNFIIGYAELLILCLFALQYRLRDKTSLFLFVFPLLSLPSLVCAQGNLYQSIFIITLLSLSAFLYQFYLKNMEWFLAKNIFNLIVLIWVSYGILTKIGQGVKYGHLASYMEPGSYGILSRGGGLGGSNHVAGIILMFLPFIKDYRIMVLCNVFLLFTFSRGVYVVLILFWIIKIVKSFSFMRIKKAALKTAFLFLAVFFLFWNCTSEIYKAEVVNWAKQRTGITSGIEGLYSRVANDARWEIYHQAKLISKETMFQGIGLGGFYWGQGLIGAKQEFSNAHNLYLTVLSEGGIFFLFGFLGLLGYMFFLSSRYSRKALLSMVIFSIYGLSSGEIYEASGLASACDYYYLIFILAYLTYLKNVRLRQKSLFRNHEASSMSLSVERA